MPVLPAKAGWGSTSDRTLLLLVARAACSRTAWEKSTPQARAPASRYQAIGTGAEGGDRHPWHGRRHAPLPFLFLLLPSEIHQIEAGAEVEFELRPKHYKTTSTILGTNVNFGEA